MSMVGKSGKSLLYWDLMDEGGENLSERFSSLQILPSGSQYVKTEARIDDKSNLVVFLG